MVGRLAAAALLVGLATGAGAQETVGSVTALTGTAEVLHPGQAARAPVQAGDPVLLGDRLLTGPESRLRLLFRDDAVLTLAAESELTVDQEVVGPATATASHSVVGTVRAVVTDRYRTPGSSFEVETPTAVAGVRGTGFIVQYDPARRVSRVVDLHGVVCVRPRQARGRSGEVCLEANQETRVEAGGRPSHPAPVDARLLQQLVAATELLSGGLEPEHEIGPGEGGPPGAAAAPSRPFDQVLPPRDQSVDQPIPELRGRTGTATPPPTTPPPPPPPPPPPGVRAR